MVSDRAMACCFFALTVAAPALAAEEATYELTFDATWSEETHPTDFPSNAHFSQPVGGLHNADVTFWEPGGIASDGIEAMAELGATVPLLDEVFAREEYQKLVERAASHQPSYG